MSGCVGACKNGLERAGECGSVQERAGASERPESATRYANVRERVRGVYGSVRERTGAFGSVGERAGVHRTPEVASHIDSYAGGTSLRHLLGNGIQRPLQI